ncbi:MAG: hypothetical protein DI538_26405, partial [Azospira oryzae]
PSRFIQKVISLSSELSANALKQMRNEGRLDEFLQLGFSSLFYYYFQMLLVLAFRTLPMYRLSSLWTEIPEF